MSENLRRLTRFCWSALVCVCCPLLVQNFFMWLAPERVELADHVAHPLGGEVPKAERRKHRATPLAAAIPPKHRLLILPSKQMPSMEHRQPHW